MEDQDIIPELVLLAKLLRSRLLVQANILSKEKDSLRQESRRKAMEQLLKPRFITELHHGGEEAEEVVD